jgi:diaminopimelate epimerase
MTFHFDKFQGAGNDFIIINRTGEKNLRKEIIAKLCDRKRGIGANGLIIIRKTASKEIFNFEYYNADGGRAGFCGNGLRCAGLFCHNLTGADKISFKTKSGLLSAEIQKDGVIKIDVPVLKMPEKISVLGIKSFFCSTGVPHLIIPVKNIEKTDVNKLGKKIRFHPLFAPEGTNVNFVQIEREIIKIRTYERGVEDETEACGSGACAAAICLAIFRNIKAPLRIETKSKEILTVDFKDKRDTLTKIKKMHLYGPAKKVFSGSINI